MSDRSEKIRALFLTFLMVMSVVGMGVAFAGSAAAEQGDITLFDGSGTQDGSYTDLDSALTDAGDDYTIELAAGDYTLSNDVTTSGLTIEGPNAGTAGDSDARGDEANVTFQANIDAENVTVDGVLYEEGSDRVEIYGANTTLKNNVVEVPDGTAPLRIHADNIVIANNVFDGPGGNWVINSRQDETNLLDGIEVTDNVFQNAGDGAVQANGWTNALISGNNFSDLDADAVRLAFNVTGTEVTDNVIRNTGQNPDNLLTTGIFLRSVEGEVEITGNEFENNPYHIAVFGNSDEPVIENNEFDKRVDVTEASDADNYIAGQIQAAVDDAAEDATVEVGPGTYNEIVTIAKKNVTLTSTAGPGQTQITNPNNHKETVEVTASNVTVDGFTVTNEGTVDSNYGSYGIRVIPRSGDISDVTVKNNILKNVSDEYRAFGISISEGETGNQLKDITVNNNTVHDIETTVTTTNAGNTIAKGIALNGRVNSSTVSDNDISNIGGEESSAAHGITLDGAGPVNFTITNNRVSSLHINESVPEDDPYFDDANALIVGGFAELGADHGVHSNSFLDGQVYRYDAGVGTDQLNATSNWWGSDAGPSHADNTYNQSEQDESVSDNIEFTPWLDAEDGEDFAPIETSAGGQYASIQEAVNQVGADGIVTIKQGTYSENVSITSENVTLKGQDNPVIDGRIDVKADLVTVKDLTVRHGAPSGSDAVEGIFVGDSNDFTDKEGHVTIRNVTIENIHSHGTSKTLEGIHVKHYNNNNIDGVEIDNVTIRNVTGPMDAGANGIKLQAGIQNVSIVRSTIDDVEGLWTYGVVATPSSNENDVPQNVYLGENSIENVSSSTDNPELLGVGLGVDGSSDNGFANPQELRVKGNTFTNNELGVLNKNDSKNGYLDVTLNWWGTDEGPLDGGQSISGQITAEPFLTASPSQIEDPEKTVDFAHDLFLESGETTLAFPAPSERTLNETVRMDNVSAVWEFDNVEGTWKKVTGNPTPDALDAYVMIVKEDETAAVTMEFNNSDTEKPVPGTTEVAGGWNFVSPTQVGASASDAFATRNADIQSTLKESPFAGPQSQPYGVGHEAFSAYRGYWTFIDEESGDSEIAANTYNGVTYDEFINNVLFPDGSS